MSSVERACVLYVCTDAPCSGNHETPGTWHFGRFDDDVDDLDAVVEYLTQTYGYVVDTIVGHSRGSVVAMLWLCKHSDGAARSVTRYVNVAGRYRMEVSEPSRNLSSFIQNRISDDTGHLQKIYGKTHAHAHPVTPRTAHPLTQTTDSLPLPLPSPDDLEAHKSELAEHGYISRRATVARKPFLSRLTQADYDAFASVDTSRAWTRFPAHVDVLTLHGLRDAVVPPYDAFVYARIYGARAPGTHVLRYVEEADHNFTGVRARCLVGGLASQ